MAKELSGKVNNKVSYDDIPNLEEDWAYNNNLDSEDYEKPYSGESVLKFIKNQFKDINEQLSDINDKKFGYIYPENDKYLVFANEESCTLYLENPEENYSLILASFDAPANYVAEIVMQTEGVNVILIGEKDNYLKFTFDIKNRDGGSTGESVVITYTFNNSGNIKTVTEIHNSESREVNLNIDLYLLPGTNSISVVVTGRESLASTRSAVTFNVVDLQLTSNFNFSNAIQKGLDLKIAYTVKGGYGYKYIEWYIDGKIQDNIDAINSNTSIQKTFSTSNMSVGKHNILFRAFITNGINNFYTDTLYYDFVISPVNETFVLLGLSLKEPITSNNARITVSTTQYKDFKYKAAVYDSLNRPLDLVIKDNGTLILVILSNQIQDLTYNSGETGEHDLSLTADSSSTHIYVTVNDGNIKISEETNGLELKLSAKGRNNNETNPGTWNYGSVETSFNNFSWNENSGWNDGALIIPPGSSIEINFKPLENIDFEYGKTIEIEYETIYSQDDESSIIDLTNNSGTGLKITASSAKLQSSQLKNVNTKYRNGDRVNLSFIINSTNEDDPNKNLMFIVNNGILERAEHFENGDSFKCNNPLEIGSDNCSIKLYGIRVYNKALTVEQAFSNYVIDSDNMLTILSNNDILDDFGNIDIDKVNAKIPVMIITGDMTSIFKATSKNVDVTVNVKYTNLLDTTKDFTIEKATIRPQGTSSLNYPRKNLNLYINKKADTVMHNYDGKLITSYSFKDGACPVDCWCLKADYAESSGSHNTGIARLWNYLMYNTSINGDYVLRTEAQKWALNKHYPYDVRTTIDGFPIVLFYKPTDNSKAVCLGQYNFNNDKSTEQVFGFAKLSVTKENGEIEKFDNTNVQCFEFKDNGHPLELFTNVSNFDNDWNKSWESRYPDTETPNLTPLKDLAIWINSCNTTNPILDNNNEQLYPNGQAKWNAEKAIHFDLPKLAAYYVYLMRFGAIDQIVKNAMLMTEDGQRWFFINYDNDTVMGINNMSIVLNRWDYVRGTEYPNSTETYYTGSASVLWNCFEGDDECMNLVKLIDQELYNTGLNYKKLIEVFDEEQCDKWCERIYNENGQYKYIQLNDDNNTNNNLYIYMLLGSRKSYRHWWLLHRLDMFDAKWGTGEFKNKTISFKAGTQISSSLYATPIFKITAANKSYFGFGINKTELVHTDIKEKDEEILFDTDILNRALFQGDPVTLYNANNIKKIDLSEFAPYLYEIDLLHAKDYNGISNLESIILGNESKTNSRSTNTLSIGGGFINLTEIDITGFENITSVNSLKGLPKLKRFRAGDSGLTSFSPAEGVEFDELVLPDTLDTLTLKNVTFNESSRILISYAGLRNLTLDNVSGWDDCENFVLGWINANTNQSENLSLSIHNIDFEVTVDQALTIGRAYYNNRNNEITGHLTLTELPTEELCLLLEEYFRIEDYIWNTESLFYIDCILQKFVSLNINKNEVILSESQNTINIHPIVFPLQQKDNIQYEIIGSPSDYTEGILIQNHTISILNGVPVGEYTMRATYGVEHKDINFNVYQGYSLAYLIHDYDPNLCANPMEMTAIEKSSITLSDLQNVKDANPDSYERTYLIPGRWTKLSDVSVFGDFENITYIPYSFFNRCRFSSIRIPENVLYIEQNAFASTYNLTEVTFNDNLERIKLLAFRDSKLTNIRIPRNVESIDDGAFIACSLIETITVDEGNTHYEALDNCLIHKDSKTLILGCKNSTIPDDANTVIKIGPRAFDSAINLKSIYIPDNITTIHEDSFLDSGLETINIGAGLSIVETISDGTFYDNIFGRHCKLRTITVSNNNRYFESTATINGTLVENILTYKYGNNDDKILLYAGTHGNIPEFVNYIAPYSFVNSNIISVTIPNNITTIGYEAFSYNPYIQELKIGESVTKIGNAFAYSCSNLRSVDMEDAKITKIPSTSFYECRRLENIKMPDYNYFKSIESLAFYACFMYSELLLLTIPNSVETIGDRAFLSCYLLTRITIGSSVREIGSGTFDNCTHVSEFYFTPDTQPTVLSDTFTRVGTSTEGQKYIYCNSNYTFGDDKPGWKMLVTDNYFTVSQTS